MRPKQINVLDVLSLSDVVDLVAERTGLFKKQVKLVLDTFRDVALEQVAAGNAIRWHHFGIFLPVVRYIRQQAPDGSLKMVPNRSQIGFAFYPTSATARLKAAVDVQTLLDRGDYNGPRNKYARP